MMMAGSSATDRRRCGTARDGWPGRLIAGAGLAVSAASPGLAGGVVGFGLVGAGLANVVPVIFSVAGRTGPSSAVGIASAATSGYAGLLLGPVVIGAVASAADLRSAIVMLAAVALFAAAFASSRAGGLVAERKASGRVRVGRDTGPPRSNQSHRRVSTQRRSPSQ
jgi:MFS family permease